MDQIIHQVLEALGVAIATGLVGLIVRLLAQLKLKLSAQAEARLAYYVQQAIAYAEEKVEALVKKNAVKVEEKAKLKIAEAINYLMSKVPGLDAVKAKDVITAGLGQSPFGASAPVIQ